MQTVELGSSIGRLTLSTGVEGKAARTGHALTIVLDDWTVTAQVEGDVPAQVSLRAAVRSLRVESGQGGLKPLSDGDRTTIRTNALEALAFQAHPDVLFEGAGAPAEGGFRLDGTLTVAGTPRPVVVEVTVTDGRAFAQVQVRQTDFGVKPYSTMFGALRVRDEVLVSVETALPPG